MHPNIRKVFISGHSSALDKAGEIASTVLTQKGVEPVIMPFPASRKAPANLSLERVSDCDAVVLLIGNIYGNLQPSSQRSIVEMEYDKAKELELDIFVFLIGNELPPNPDKEDADRLERFIRKIRAEHTYCQDLSPLKNLAANIGGAIEQASRYRAFVGPKVFFRSRLSEAGSIFRIEPAKLLGRQAELDALKNFYAGTKGLLFLIGPAGSGKSHLLYEFATAGIPKGDWTGFWNGLDAGASALQDIRFDTWKKGLIVIECGDETDLKAVAGLLTNILNTKQAQAGHLKAVVTIRNYMRPECQAVWGRIFSDAAHADQLNLDGLTDNPESGVREWIIERTRPVVINTDHARAILESTRGLPLLITLAVDLIKSKSVSVSQLAGGKAFRDVYLDALLRNVTTASGKSNFEDFLRLAALLSPFGNGDQSLQERAAQVLGITPSDWIDLSDVAVELGVLKRTLRTCRVYPEIFGDYLVDRACYGQDGSPKLDWVQRVLDAFITAEFGGGVYARHTAAVVRNLASTEFRHQEPSRPSPLWTILEEAFESADNLGKQQWLKLFREIAYYKPAWALKLAKKVMADSQSYPRQEVWGNHFVSGQDLINELSPVVFPAACHFDHLKEASDLLWDIALQDTRKPGPHPEHALRQLQNLAEYKEAKPFAYTDLVLDRVLDWLKDAKVNEAAEISPVALAGNAFEKQIERTDWFRHSISIGTRFLTPSGDLDALRAKARRIMTECLEMKYGPLCARHAIEVLSEDIKPPHGVGGAALSPELRKAWAPEQLKSLSVLESFVKSPAPFPLKFIVFGKLSWSGKNHPTQELQEGCRKLCEVISGDPEFSFTEVLLGKAWEDRTKDRDAAAAKLAQEFPTPERLVAKLTELSQMLTIYFADKHRMGLGALVHAISKANMRLGLDTATRLIEENTPKELVWLANPLIFPARWQKDLYPEFLKLTERLISEKISDALYNLPSWFRGLAQELKPEEWPIVEQLPRLDETKQNDMTYYLLRDLSKKGEAEKNRIKALILSLPDLAPDEVRVADAVCQSLGKAGEEGLTSADFEEADVRRFTWKFKALKEISADSYWLAEWLAFVGGHFPDLLLEFFVERMKYSREHQGEEFRAIPFEGDLHQYFSQTRPESRVRLAKELVDTLSTEHDSKDYDVRSLIWHVLASDFASTVACFQEKARGGEDGLKKAVYLLQEAPPGFATSEASAQFVLELLTAARGISADFFARTLSTLVSSATSGAMVGRAGQPPDRLIELTAKCDSMLAKLDATDPRRELYRALRDRVALDIKSFQEDDL